MKPAGSLPSPASSASILTGVLVGHPDMVLGEVELIKRFSFLTNSLTVRMQPKSYWPSSLMFVLLYFAFFRFSRNLCFFWLFPQRFFRFLLRFFFNLKHSTLLLQFSPRDQTFWQIFLSFLVFLAKKSHCFGISMLPKSYQNNKKQ